MTWPSEIKPREGEKPGTRFEEYQIGDVLPPLGFTVTPEVIQAYAQSVLCDEGGYEVGGRMAAPTSVLAVYLMAVLYRRFPPLQGGVMAANSFEFYRPLWVDEDTELVGSGYITNKTEKRGRKYVSYCAEFATEDGALVARAANSSTFPG